MTTVCYYSLTSVIIVSLISLVGVFTFGLKLSFLKKITVLLVSFSAGALLGDALIHLLPEATKNNQGLALWLWVLGGIIVFFVLEKIIFWRHCHIPTSEKHPHPLGIMNMIGDGLHNFIDGAMIAGSFLISLPLGLTTTIAIIAHEIPQEIGNFGVLMHAGYGRLRALALNFLSAIFAILGTIITLVFGSKLDGLVDLIIPFTAGSFIYIATADLLPELKKEPQLLSSLNQLIFILFGIGLMLILKFLLE